MQVDQPIASSSTSSGPTQHLATFVIDRNLPREQYGRLTESDGIVHQLVQRLMEKHGGENHLLLNVVLTPALDQPAFRARGQSKVETRDWAPPSAFLTSLPKLASNFAVGGIELGESRWGSFGSTRSVWDEEESASERNRRKAELEEGLMAGMESGIEVLQQTVHAQLDSSGSLKGLTSILPPSATSILPELQSPAGPSSASSSHIRTYLIGVFGAPPWMATPTTDSQTDGRMSSRWTSLADECKESDIRPSYVVQDYGHEEGTTPQESDAAKRLRNFFDLATDAKDDPWFDVPPDVNLRLSGMVLPPGTVPPSPTLPEAAPPPALSAATMPQANLNNAQNAASILRHLQSQLAARGQGNTPISPAILQILAAAQNKQIPSDTAAAQLRNLLTAQQMQKSTQASLNPAAAAAAAAAGQGGEDRAVLDAIQQQRQAQAAAAAAAMQNATANGLNRQVSGGFGAPNQQKVWAGDIVWTLGTTNKIRVPVEAHMAANNSMEITNLPLPQELRASSTGTLALAEIESYYKSHNVPVMQLLPSDIKNAANVQRFWQIAQGLAKNATVTPITLGASSNHGLFVYAQIVPSSTGTPKPRLMALLCLTTPFPPYAPAGRTQQQTAQQAAAQAQAQALQQFQQQAQAQAQAAQVQQPPIAANLPLLSNAAPPRPVQPISLNGMPMTMPPAPQQPLIGGNAMQPGMSNIGNNMGNNMPQTFFPNPQLAAGQFNPLSGFPPQPPVQQPVQPAAPSSLGPNLNMDQRSKLARAAAQYGYILPPNFNPATMTQEQTKEMSDFLREQTTKRAAAQRQAAAAAAAQQQQAQQQQGNLQMMQNIAMQGQNPGVGVGGAQLMQGMGQMNGMQAMQNLQNMMRQSGYMQQ